MNSDLVNISKKLSWLLRHGAHKCGVPISSDGYVYINDILKLEAFKNVTLEKIKQVVELNEKKRFVLSEDSTGNLKIKACQGHSIDVPNLELTPIRNCSEAPVVLHGTNKQAWEIIKNEGLSRMKRQYIHFCPGLPGQNEVISGYRPSSKVVISIDIEKALKDGLKFFRSPNNVILSPGNDRGYILPCYFKHVNIM